jgi:hypothetical protein
VIPPNQGNGPSAATVTVYDLVIQARAQAAFPALRLQLKPDLRLPDGRQAGLVGVPTWYWLDRASWAPITTHAAAGPLSVTVTATPSALSIFPGDDQAFACNGPGTPLNDTSTAMAGSPDCGHTYEVVSTQRPAGEYTVVAAITWTVTWQASTGETGATEPVTIQTSTPYVVRQARAHLVA